MIRFSSIIIRRQFQLLFLIIISTLGLAQTFPDSLQIPGWKLVWNDEFDSNTINYSMWQHDIGTGAPIYEDFGESSSEFAPLGFPEDQFSVSWEGYILPEFTSEYTFYIIADDGVRLWVNDLLLIDKWIPQAPTEWSGKINLIAGQKYSIKVEYFEDSGWETLIMGWSCKHLNKELVPSKSLFTKDGKSGLTGHYFANKSLRENDNSLYYTRIDSVINWATGTGWGNNEQQYYTDNPKNIRVENGKLVIEAHHEKYRGSSYSSSRIKTTHSWKYGRFEIKAKLPSGRGTWSAIWGLPTEWVYGGWPESGEIDIVEHVGFNEDHIVSSVHNNNLAGNLYQSNQQSSLIVENSCTQFHTYVLEWDENMLQMFVDDRQIFEYANEHQGWVKWPFDKKYHMLMNIAVGGSWGGAKGIDDSAFPAKMEIEYFRVYQK